MGAGMVILTLAGCSATPGTSPSPSPSYSGPAAIDVRCNEDLSITVSSATVAATSAGVVLNVSSEAPAGAYLNYGTGGDELPAGPATWTLGNPPGPMTLSCSTLEVEGDPVTVTVADPNGYWSNATTEDLGCVIGGMPGWAIEGGSGSTPDDALAELAANFNATTNGEPLTTWRPASAGYPDATRETWVVGTAEKVKITAIVVQTATGYESYPDALCVEGPWADS